jgi:competence protein ComEA
MTSFLTTFRQALLVCALAFVPVLGAQAQAKGGDGAAQPAAASSTVVINVNTATEQELMLLPGVGPARAAAILALRAQLNGFKKVEDLMRVKGIGRKTLKKLEPMVRLSGASSVPSGKPGSRPAR